MIKDRLFRGTQPFDIATWQYVVYKCTGLHVSWMHVPCPHSLQGGHTCKLTEPQQIQTLKSETSGLISLCQFIRIPFITVLRRWLKKGVDFKSSLVYQVRNWQADLPMLAVQLQESCSVALQPASLPTAGEMCYKNYTTGTKTPHTVLCRVSPMHVVKAECFQLVACRHAFLGPVNYQPEISLLECSSGLLLLKPKPPPLSGLLRDPVFVFPEVMEPRCKLLYLWQQSLFLREEKKNINVGTGRALPPAMHYCNPHAQPLSDLLITPTSFSNTIPNEITVWCLPFLPPTLTTVGKGNF